MLDKRRARPAQSARPTDGRGGLGSPENRRDSRASDGQRLFYCACMACPVMGGPCGDTREGVPEPVPGLPTLHGLPTPLGREVGGNSNRLNRNQHMHTNTSASAPIVFQFQSEAEIRVITIDDEPWFVGKDVAIALGYADHTNAIKQHCKGVVKRHPLQTSGGIQEIRIIAQADVLRLIVGSKLPSAVKFERWVFEEVLPSILKTGQYKVGAGATADITPAPVDTSLVNATHITRILRELAHTAKFMKHTPAPQAKLEKFLLQTFGLACLHLLPVDRVEQVSHWLHQLRLQICEHDVCLETLEARFLAQVMVPQLEAA